MPEAATPEERMRDLAAALADLGRAFVEQAEFHGGERALFEARSLDAAADLARRRLGRFALAGPRWRREIEKTALINLAQGALSSRAALREAGEEAWPDLARACERALEAVRGAAARDPGLFAVAGLDRARLEGAEPSGAPAPPGWQRLESGCHARLDERSIPLLAVPWPGEAQTWLAQAGGVSAGFFPHAAAAAEAAEAASALLFAPAPG